MKGSFNNPNEWKKFPLRDKTKEKVDFCSCSHSIFRHTGWKYNNTKGECEECECPKYTYHTSLTMNESRELISKGLNQDAKYTEDYEIHSKESVTQEKP